MLNKVCCG